MTIFLFINIIFSALNIFVIIYAYSLNFFPKKWRKKVNQDTFVGLALNFFYNDNWFFVGFLLLSKIILVVLSPRISVC